MVISSLFFYSLHVYRRPTCVCDEHVWSRIMIAVAGDMIMIAALLLHNNNLGRGGVVLWCTGHAAAVHACHHQLSRARGCTRGCCYYATSCRGGPHTIGRYQVLFAGLICRQLTVTNHIPSYTYFSINQSPCSHHVIIMVRTVLSEGTFCKNFSEFVCLDLCLVSVRPAGGWRVCPVQTGRMYHVPWCLYTVMQNVTEL